MKPFIRLILFSILPCTVFGQAKMNAPEILRQAEAKRMPWTQMSFLAMLTDSGSNGLSITDYHVFLKDDEALVACTRPVEQKGNLLLLQSRNMWLYIKATAQPVKITPLQRLSGSVSFVDMARLNWTTDYSIDSIKPVKPGDYKSQDAYLLYLHAVSQEISYNRINLWVDKSSKRPLKADIYVGSDKLYKTMLFTKYQVIAGKDINTSVEFTDHFNKDRKSVIDILKPKQEKNLPESYFMKEKLPAVSKEMISDSLPGGS